MKKLNPKQTIAEVIAGIFSVLKVNKASFFQSKSKHKGIDCGKKRLAYIVVTSLVIAIMSSFTALNYWHKLQNAEEQLMLAKGRTQMMALNVKVIQYKLQVIASITEKASLNPQFSATESISYNNLPAQSTNDYRPLN